MEEKVAVQGRERCIDQGGGTGTTEHGWVYTDLDGLRGLNCSSWLIGWGCILGGLDGPRACLIYGWAGLDWVGAWVTSNKIDMIAIDVYVLTR